MSPRGIDQRVPQRGELGLSAGLEERPGRAQRLQGLEEARRRLNAAWKLVGHRVAVIELGKVELWLESTSESDFEIVKTNSRRVKRWNGSSMVLRRRGTGLVKSESQFRRVNGYTPMPKLITARDNKFLPESKQPA